MFYGMSFAFDKSLSGDEDITAALLRNFYDDDKSKQKSAEALARYTTRSELAVCSIFCMMLLCCWNDIILACPVQGAGMSC